MFNSLPRIDERINKRALAVRNGLNFLPKPPGGNVSLFVKSAIEELRSLLQARIDGGNLEYTFFTKWHDMAKGFRSNVCNSHAKLVLDDPKLRAPPIRDRRYPSVSESPPAATQDEPINLDSGDEVATVTAPASSLKRRREENDSPNKRPEKRVFKSKRKSRVLSPQQIPFLTIGNCSADIRYCFHTQYDESSQHGSSGSSKPESYRENAQREYVALGEACN